MEKIVYRVNKQELERQALQWLEEFPQRIQTTPIRELSREIAERNFREPIILFDKIAIRRFWRDGKEAPPLPLSKRADAASRGHY